MSQADARLWAMVEAAAKSVTDEVTGHYKKEAFAAELDRRLSEEEVPEHVQQVVREEAVKRLVDGFHRRRQPQVRRQGGLYDPGYVLALGHGERVWMAQAGHTDLIAWAALEAKNAASVLAAAGRRQAYVAERLPVMNAHPDWKLDRVEQEVFGFTPDVEDPPDDAESEWDEDDE